MVRLSQMYEDVLQEWGQAIGETIRNNLIPSWTSFLMQLVAFIILLLVVVFLAYKPVKKMLKARQDFIENEISDAKKSKSAAELNFAQSQEAILASKKEASQIIEEAKLTASKEQEAIIADTKKEVAKMKADAEKDIERSRQEALDDIHKEMVDIALLTTSEILKREVNEEDDSRLAKEFIDKL